MAKARGRKCAEKSEAWNPSPPEPVPTMPGGEVVGRRGAEQSRQSRQ